jgi:DNA-binding MarR family transcriptional regulator
MFVTPAGLSDFLMVDRAAAANVVALARSRDLLPRDIAVLMALIAGWAHTDNTTDSRSAALADQLGANRADVARSLARIRKAGLLACWRGRRSNDGRRILESRGVLNPTFVTAGGSGRRKAHEERFRAALS